MANMKYTFLEDHYHRVGGGSGNGSIKSFGQI